MTVRNATHRNEPLLTGPVRWFLLFSFVANAGLTLLFAALPFFAEQTTGNAIAAGLTTGVMMLATVLVELVTPRLMARLGYRRVMEIGVVLLGFPSLILVVFPNLGTILLVAAARGAGLAASVVAGTALAARIFPAHRRAEGLGLYGLATSISAVVLLPLGLWLTERFGFELVALVTVGAAVLGLAIGRNLPAIHPGEKQTDSILRELRDPGIARPTIVFGIATLAIGILVTYLALAVPEDARNVAAIGLFVQGACTSAARWGSGRLGDRLGSARLLMPSMLLAAVGMLGIVATDTPAAVIAGMAVFGLGLGGAQNASLAVMFERAHHDRFAQVSVIWNLAYDAGMGIGAVGFGVVIGLTGYPWGFALVAALLFAAAALAWRDRVLGGPVVTSVIGEG